MDSAQIAFVIEQAYKCPVDFTAVNAQAVIYLLYGVEVPECDPIQTRDSKVLVKDVEFTLPDTDAWVEDNFPDPFINETLINYYLPEGSAGSVVLNDIYGRNIRTYNLLNGENTLTLIKEDLTPGVYTYGFVVDGKIIEYKKMVITQ
jgi:hypothetical protein